MELVAQKNFFSKYMKELNIFNLLDLIGMYRTLQSKFTKYTYFSRAHLILFKKDHILAHKISLNTFKKNQTLIE